VQSRFISGMRCAQHLGMAARHFTELVAWQLADELRGEIIAFTVRSPCCKDFKYCTQIKAAADSVCFNTSEGFGRYRPKEFERFLGYAKGSLEEVQDALISARRKRYLSDAEFHRTWALSKRAVGANAKLQTYLRTDGRHGPPSNSFPRARIEKQEPGTWNLDL
jgi:four helix bundle protein